MTAYNPQPFVRVNGVTWTGDTLEGVTITAGRDDINDQPRAGYSRVTIVTPDTANYPNIEIDQVIEIGVLDTSAAEKILFTGQVSDIQVSLGAFGDTGFLVTTSITAVGRLALLNRLGAGASGYAEELDGIRVQNIVDDALALDYPEYGDYYGQGTDPTRINLILNPSIEVNTTGWQLFRATASRITTDSFIGGACLQLVANTTLTGSAVFNQRNTTYRTPIIPGNTYTVSAYVKRTVGTRNFRIRLMTFSTATIVATTEDFNGTSTNISNEWVRLTVTGTPTNPAGVFGQLAIEMTQAGSIGDTLLVDGFLFEQAPAPVGTYFDGNSTNSIWNGTANDSTSTKTNAGTYLLAGTQTWATLDPYLTTFDAGNYDIQTYAAAEANAYSLATAAAQSGLGVLYETADNRIGYKDAESRVDETNFSDLPANVIIASGIQATQRAGDIANDITLTYDTNQTVQDDNQDSIDIYGRLKGQVNTILADVTSANTLLDYYLQTRSLPRRTLESLQVALHLDTMENTLRDELLDIEIGMGIRSVALPEAIYSSVFTGFVEGWTWTITRNTLFLQMRVSEYELSVIAQDWSQVDPILEYDTMNATLTWQEARVIT